jgi:hypothetical protein
MSVIVSPQTDVKTESIPVNAVLVPPEFCDPFADDFTHCPDECAELPVSACYEGSTEITVHFKQGRWWVDWRVGDQLEGAWQFASGREAREWARALFGTAGCAETDLSPNDIAMHAGTVSALTWAAENLDPADPIGV